MCCSNSFFPYSFARLQLRCTIVVALIKYRLIVQIVNPPLKTTTVSGGASQLGWLFLLKAYVFSTKDLYMTTGLYVSLRYGYIAIYKSTIKCQH
jgi:hypothetical protein